MIKADFPYIGVTGFMTRSHVSSILAAFPLQKLPTHRLMVGVLVSSKTVIGEKNSWPGRYPEIDKVKDIFVRDRHAINLVHFNTKDPRPLFSQLFGVHTRIGDGFDGFQLNIAWPSISDLEDYYENYGNSKYLVLQVGAKAMAQLGDDPEMIAEQIGHYLPMIDYVLIDPSGGLGRPFDPEKAIRILSAINNKGYNLRLGIAGGFGPNSMDHLVQIAEMFPGISIDAEGKLRTPQPEDRQDMDATRDYIVRASEILK